MPETEADTCRKYVLPNLYQAGWTDDQINEQHPFAADTDIEKRMIEPTNRNTALWTLR
jgi:hypothetical protein